MRLSFAQTRSRPDFSQLNPSVSLGSPDPTRNNIRSGSGGNPNLRPFRSNNYDASLEWYFSPTGFASVAGFRRDLTDFVQTQPNQYNDPVLGPVEITQPINTGRGRINGAEAQVSTFFDFEGVPAFLKSFGVQANYTYVDGKVQNPTDPRVSLTQLSYGPILGVSKNSFNIVGLFERGPLSLRLTYNKRSSFLDFQQFRGSLDSTNGGYGDRDVFTQIGHPAGRLDLSTNLKFTPNATLFFDATNLTSSPVRYTFTSARGGAASAEYVRFLRFEERTFSGGLRFRF